MSKFRLACHLIQFGGEERRDPAKVLREVAEAGWEGVEAMPANSPEELVAVANLARSYGLHLVNNLGPGGQSLDSVKYNITLGNSAAEVPFLWRTNFGGANPADADFERAARSVDDILAYCVKHGVKGFQHAHMGAMIETVEDAECLLSKAPDLWLLLDTGHMTAAGSDPLRVFQSPILRNRIAHVHLKDCHADDPATWNHRAQRFGEQARFAELGAGNLGLSVPAVLKALEELNYDGWVAVELDRPYPDRPPAEAARVNRDYLRKLGY
jgi:sugar phosphate isomerase/epimerase